MTRKRIVMSLLQLRDHDHHDLDRFYCCISDHVNNLFKWSEILLNLCRVACLSAYLQPCRGRDSPFPDPWPAQWVHDFWWSVTMFNKCRSSNFVVIIMYWVITRKMPRECDPTDSTFPILYRMMIHIGELFRLSKRGRNDSAAHPPTFRCQSAWE